MTREEKEKFIIDTWGYIHEPEDRISLTALSQLSDKSLDRLVELYKKLLKE